MNFENSDNTLFTPLAFEKEVLKEIATGFLNVYPEWVIFYQENVSVTDIYNVLTLWLFFSDSLHMNFKMPTFSESCQNKFFWKDFIQFIQQQEFAPLSELDKAHLMQVILAKTA